MSKILRDPNIAKIPLVDEILQKMAQPPTDEEKEFFQEAMEELGIDSVEKGENNCVTIHLKE